MMEQGGEAKTWTNDYFGLPLAIYPYLSPLATNIYKILSFLFLNYM